MPLPPVSMKDSKDSANTPTSLHGQTHLGLAGTLHLQKFWTLGLLGLWMALLFFSPVDPNYTSGELLDHAYAWKETGLLYPSLQSAPYRVLNYPPLYLAATRWISHLGLPLKAS